jgi:hypothetical protein
MSEDEDAKKKRKNKNVHKDFYQKYAPSSGPNPLNVPPQTPPPEQGEGKK